MDEQEIEKIVKYTLDYIAGNGVEGEYDIIRVSPEFPHEKQSATKEQLLKNITYAIKNDLPI